MSDFDADRTGGHLLPGTTAEQRAAASRMVLRHARDHADLRHLLTILGLRTSTQKGQAA